MPERAKQVLYRVHSTVMSQKTRSLRHRTPGKHRWVQHLAAGEIVVRRARPATITEDQLLKHIEELQDLNKTGKIEVRTPSGLLVDLFTLEVEEAPNPLKTPAKRPDSIADDEFAVLGRTPADTLDIDELVSEVQQPLVTHAEGMDPAKRRKSERSEREGV